MARPELHRVSVFALSCCEAAEPAMGPYFLFTAADWSRCDSRKGFSAAIDLPSAICLSFLIGDTSVGLAAAQEVPHR